MAEEKIRKIDFKSFEREHGWLIESGLIDEHGLRVSGLGNISKKLDKLCELVDKTNLKIYYLEKKLAELLK